MNLIIKIAVEFYFLIGSIALKIEKIINMNKTPVTAKIIFMIMAIVAIVSCIDLAFYLMNQADTMEFVFGIIVLIASIGFPIEVFLIIKNKNKK